MIAISHKCMYLFSTNSARVSIGDGLMLNRRFAITQMHLEYTHIHISPAELKQPVIDKQFDMHAFINQMQISYRCEFTGSGGMVNTHARTHTHTRSAVYRISGTIPNKVAQ